MPKKKDLLEKLCRKPIPKNFTTRELYSYQVKKTIQFIKDINEFDE